MLVLIDTGILLRLLEPSDPHYASIRIALRTLRGRGDTLVTSAQNAAEFWNVCTRPVWARGGLGLTVVETDRRLRIIERLFRGACSSPTAFRAFKPMTRVSWRSCRFMASPTS